MTNPRSSLTEEAAAKLTGDEKAWFETARHYHPVNVRVLEGVDLGKLKVMKVDGAALPPTYVNP